MKRVVLIGSVLLLAGCGGSSPPKARQPHLPRGLAASWRAQADAVAAALAAGDGCTAQARAAALQSSVVDAVNTHRVSPRFQETLTAAVNDLAGRITCAPPVIPERKSHEHHPKPPKHGHGHGKKDD